MCFKLCALNVTERARARILKSGGQIITFDQLALKSPKGQNTVLMQGMKTHKTASIIVMAALFYDENFGITNWNFMKISMRLIFFWEEHYDVTEWVNILYVLRIWKWWAKPEVTILLHKESDLLWDSTCLYLIGFNVVNHLSHRLYIESLCTCMKHLYHWLFVIFYSCCCLLMLLMFIVDWSCRTQKVTQGLQTLWKSTWCSTQQYCVSGASFSSWANYFIA